MNSILTEPVSNIELNTKTILEKDLYDDKVGILDIRAKINDNIDCDIEMQVVNQKNVEKRVVYYLSKMYSENVKEGENYSKSKKCIAILFADFNLDNLAEIPEYLTKWNFREENYSHIVLTDVLEIYILEMPKVKQYNKNDDLDNWVKFITMQGEIDMENANEAVKKARKVLEEISQDEHERYLAELRLKNIMDKKAIEEYGYEKGIEEKQQEIAKKLKEAKVDIEIIANSTGLTKEEIEKL